MNRKEKASLCIFGLCAVLSAAVLLICALYLLPKARQAQTQIEASGSALEVYLQNPWGSPFRNQVLLDSFQKPPAPERTNTGRQAAYHSPEGITFTSDSAAWDEAKLQTLYEELLKNKHGEELFSLSQVTVFPQEDKFAAATHQNVNQYNTLDLSAPIFPKYFSFTFSRSVGQIVLYDGDRLTSAEAMANNLSHEYGHHYTFYHMFPAVWDDRAMLQSDYMQLRKPGADRIHLDSGDMQFYYDNHHWYLVEIAAEDYVTLMGSPNARDVVNYYDIRDYLNGYENGDYGARNGAVQENLMLPMASDIPGLADYFYGFIGEPPPVFPQKQEINLQVQPQTAEYDLITGYESFLSYELSWDKAYGDDAIYTLVAYEESNYAGSLQPIRTVNPGERASAIIGNATINYGDSVSYADDGLAAGTKCFVVNVILPDGTMQTSTPVSYTFS